MPEATSVSRQARRFLPAAAVLGSVVLCAAAVGVRPWALFSSDGLAKIGPVFSALAHPDLSPEFLLRILHLSLESLLIGCLGTALAAVLGISLAYVATRIPGLPDPPGRNRGANAFSEGTRFAARLVLGFLRTIPDVVWAYLFVRILGLGAGPGVLAIAVVTGGSIGKLYSELAEAVDPRPVRSLAASGASRFGIFVYAVLPQVRRQWAAYALFRLECSLRTATILGVVGAGGLGTEIALSIRYFEYDKLATALLAVLAFVVMLELVTSLLRPKGARVALAIAAATTIAAFLYLDVPWIELFSRDAISRSLGLFSGGGSASEGLPIRGLMLVLQTVMMAWVATFLAACAAMVISPLASAGLTVRDYLSDAHQGHGFGRTPGWIAFLTARSMLQVTRALPELTLALLFVLWVGPGPWAGILAIAVHTIGVLGRLYLDAYDMVEPEPVAAIDSIGASRLGAWLFGVLPQASPRILAYSLYRFEVNVRATAVVGFVGAGGVGDALHTSISLFHIGDLIVLLSILYGVVTLVDFAGDRVRGRVLRGATLRPEVPNAPLDDVDSNVLAGQAEQRRQRRRIDISRIVRWRPLVSAAPMETARVLNLSPTGMFVCTEGPAPEETLLEFEMPDLERGGVFEVFGRVKLARRGMAGEVDGMGVVFLNLDERAKDAIARAINPGPPPRKVAAR